MSLCFCHDCRAGYAALGADPEALRAGVCDALEPVWRGGVPADVTVDALLGTEPAALTMEFRARTARTFQEEAVAAVRATAPDGFRVLLHADPVTHRCGANAGVDPAHVLGLADGVVVPCTGGTGLLAPFARHASAGSVVAANLTVVGGMGGSPGTLAEDAARAASLGANELRLYHAGLASDQDLAAVRDGLSRLR